MSIFNRQIQFIDEVERAVQEEFKTAIARFGFVMRDFIINKQLFREGIDGKGERLPGYSRTTIRLKLSKGDPVDRTTLKDEGTFHASIEIDAFDDHFEISSNVPHDRYIIARYGKDVLKVTEENMIEFVTNFFIPNYRRYVFDQFTK